MILNVKTIRKEVFLVKMWIYTPEWLAKGCAQDHLDMPRAEVPGHIMSSLCIVVIFIGGT